MSDREPTVINRDSGGGWAVAAILLIVVIAGAFILYASGYLGDRDVNIDVSLPKVQALEPVTK
jgi:hypothetical protein